MANDFKRFCVPSVGTSLTTLYTVPAGASSSALESIVIGITMANKSTSGITASIFIDNEDGSNDVYIVKDANIPAGASLEVMSGNKLVLMNDGSNADNLEGIASAATSLDVTVSVLEDV
ncbi:MAG: hypothetical protein H8D84_00195 [Proteobacteria bacterium]|nr:hypothetical protein [Pseudomonadota bacterium]